MKKLALWGVVALVVAVAPPDVRADFSQDFQIDTSGWFTFAGSGNVNQEADGYVSPVPYASGVASASPTNHARLRRGDCTTDPSGGGGPSVECDGPFTRWGGYNTVWNGGYTTQVDVYLDVPYAVANPDSYAGNLACLTADPSDNTCKGTRFDFSSAIQDAGGGFVSDFVFNVGTGDPMQPNPCMSGGMVIAASNNAFRSSSYPQNPGKDPFCVDTSGWYTFKHSFTDVAGLLVVVMELFPQGNPVPLHTWTLPTTFATADLGCNLYGWFAEQEIQDLAIDNSIMIGCGAPLTTTTVTTTTTTTSSTTSTTPPSSCGNSFVEAGEQCDPPTSPCLTSPGGAFGTCDGACQCIENTTTTTVTTVTTTSSSSSSVTSTITTTSTTATTLASSCGNAVIDPGEQCDPPTSPCLTSPGGAFGTCDGTCQCVANTTTTAPSTTVSSTSTSSSTLATTTSSTVATTTSTLATTTTVATTSTTTTTICSPQPENTSPACSDSIDNDCDGLVDCADPDCSDFFPCNVAAKDPTIIQFGRNGQLDRIHGHAKLEMVAVNVAALPVRVLLSDLQGSIYVDGLPAGTLTTSPKGTVFRFRDATARTNGGMYDTKIKRNKDGRTYTFSFTSYGDLSRATDAHMRLQFYVGTDANAAQDGRVFITIDTPWTKTPRGWRAPKDH